MKNFELSGISYKANLHCHTTVSDGQNTPEEVKKLYMEQGYSVVAYTDHNALLDHSDLCDDKFVALNGYEIEANEPNCKDYSVTHVAHICFIAKKKDNLSQVCTTEGNVWGNARKYIPSLNLPDTDYVRRYTHEGVSDIMKRGHESGFFVTYNHPTWSLENYAHYSGYSGMDAMEIFNTGCFAAGFDEYNSHCYDDLLLQGKKIFCIAADDNHQNANTYATNPACDCFGGWVSIFAEKLEYEAITKALEEGRFYCSTGPEIKSFRVEDGYAYITTSPAHKISYLSGRRRTQQKTAFYGDSVCEAKFKIEPDDVYFRIDVTDDHGYHANTNAIFTEDIF